MSKTYRPTPHAPRLFPATPRQPLAFLRNLPTLLPNSFPFALNPSNHPRLPPSQPHPARILPRPLRYLLTPPRSHFSLLRPLTPRLSPSAFPPPVIPASAQLSLDRSLTPTTQPRSQPPPSSRPSRPSNSPKNRPKLLSPLGVLARDLPSPSSTQPVLAARVPSPVSDRCKVPASSSLAWGRGGPSSNQPPNPTQVTPGNPA